ncbi:MAG: Zn-dependent hydrolase [Nocardioides sp.]|nr:Zn-dependent hydrolase [Nocardioides sp.]
MRLGTRSVPQMDRHAEGSARGACHSGIRYWDVRCGLAGVDSLGGGTRSPPASAQRIDADLVDLARIADDSLPGFTRQALTPFDEEGRESTLRKMRDAGLTAQIDAAGNVIGVLDGTHPEAGLVMTGSHTNTVESGGRFDGNVGVAAALEVVRTLRATATFLRHTLMVLVFFNEEPNRFGQSCVGSRALVGELEASDLATRDAEGVSFAEALTGANLDPAQVLNARMDISRVRAFVELHVEQGPHLVDQGSQTASSPPSPACLAFVHSSAARPTMLGPGRWSIVTTRAVLPQGRSWLSRRSCRVTLTAAHHRHGDLRSRCRHRSRRVRRDVGRAPQPDATWLTAASQELASAAEGEAKSRGVDLEFEWLPSKQRVSMTDGLGSAARSGDRLGHAA